MNEIKRNPRPIQRPTQRKHKPKRNKRQVRQGFTIQAMLPSDTESKLQSLRDKLK